MKRLRYQMVDDRPTYKGVRIVLGDKWMAYTCPASAGRFVAHYREGDVWITVNDFLTDEDAITHLVEHYESIGVVIIT